jgi:hypothetical protein
MKLVLILLITPVSILAFGIILFMAIHAIGEKISHAELNYMRRLRETILNYEKDKQYE